MDYRSTRGSISNSLNSAEAVIQGLAPDGGLYVPVAFPKPTIYLAAIAKLTYKETAKLVLSLFFDDYTDAQLDESIQAAYGQQFDDAEIVPVTKNH
ncbi:MAG: threonine synthase, partial [Paucilactobacillus nenjiangensis]